MAAQRQAEAQALTLMRSTHTPPPARATPDAPGAPTGATSRTTPLPNLLATFERLTQVSPRRDRRQRWWPFALIAALVLLMTGLFGALLLEDLASRKDALRRDVNSAAQQVAARFGAIKETVLARASEMGTHVMGSTRFDTVMHELMVTRPDVTRPEVTRPEVRRIAFFDENDTLRWLAAEGDDAFANDVAIETPPAALQRARTTQTLHVESAATHPTQRHAGLLLIVPVTRQDHYIGAMSVHIALADLLRESVQPDIAVRYQLSLLWHDPAAAGTSDNDSDDYDYSTRVATLPAGLHLAGRAVAQASMLPGGNLLWIAVALAFAVAGTLFVLARYTGRLVETDHALLAEASLRRAMENSLATGLRVLDASGTICYVNRAFCRMTGWSEADLIGSRPPFVYWPPHSIAENVRKHQRVLAGEAPAEGLEVVIQRPDGSRFDARMYVSPLQDDSGRQIGWLTSMTDVTEPNRIRNALAEAHRRFLTVLESLEAAVSVVADSGGAALLFANRSYHELFDGSAAAHLRLSRALAEQRTTAGEVVDTSTHRWFDARVRPLRWPGKTASGERGATLLIAADITLRKSMEDMVREQQEKVQFTARLMTLGEMASTLAHELNQPLTAIANYCEGTLARLSAGRLTHAELESALDKTAKQARRAGQIIRRIREFVKRSHPQRSAVPVQRIVEDAIGFAQIDATRRDASIQVSIEPDLPPLDADPLLIEQVLLNLLKNSIDASHAVPGARVQLKVVRRGEFVQFEVIDHGSGISEAHAARLFEPFFSTKPEGMGLGLSICRSIVEFHGGRLTVLANPQGTAGTTARFTLPLFPLPLSPFPLASPTAGNETAQLASDFSNVPADPPHPTPPIPTPHHLLRSKALRNE